MSRTSPHLLISLSVFLSSCCCFQNGCDFGRPGVLCYRPQTVIDYNECFVLCDLSTECRQMRSRRKEPLTAEMFDPYVPIDPDYSLSRGDTLEISVYEEKEADVENAMVAPDGKLYFAFLDGIPVEGKTATEVAADITEGLKGLFLNPSVSVTPIQTRSLTYRILGRVMNPGEFPISGPITVLEGIAEAGGLITTEGKEQEDASRYLIAHVDTESSFLARGDKKLDIDFKRLIYEGDASQNIYLRPGDYIYFSPYIKKDVFVLGALFTPQRLPFLERMTLMGALAGAGGWPAPSPYSPDLENIVVIRGTLSCPRVCIVDANKILSGEARDLFLQPGDIVYASRKQFRYLRDLALIALESFLVTFGEAAGEHFSDIHWFTSNGSTNGDTDDD